VRARAVPAEAEGDARTPWRTYDRLRLRGRVAEARVWSLTAAWLDAREAEGAASVRRFREKYGG